MNQKNIFFLFLCLGVFSLCGQTNSSKNYAQYVNPFVGTDFHGHTYPGALLPFGMVQLSPDTRLSGWDGCSAYHYSDSVVYGFSHTHLSGTGCSDYGDVLIMPFTGYPSTKNTEYCSRFSHKNEIASPGYYSVILDKNNVKVELTASQRVGVHKYTFPAEKMIKGIVIDLAHRDLVLNSGMGYTGDNQIGGFRFSKAWAENQELFFSILFSVPVKDMELFEGDNFDPAALRFIRGKDSKAIVFFDEDVTEVVIKVAISSVDGSGCVENHTEISGFDFEKVKQEAIQAWNKELGKIEVETSDVEVKKIFYTALYHSFTAPYLYSDKDGRYSGMDGNRYMAKDNEVYTVFSLWDTYRALHPLLSIIDRKRTKNFIYTFLKHYEQGKMLPIWELSGNETWCMIGYHSIPVILDAYVKGIDIGDKDLMLKAMIESAKLDKLGRTEYVKYGYIPGDKEPESVSKTLEYAFDDWCIARFAKAIGKEKEAAEFLHRSQFYKNILDPDGFMHPKENGGFVSPFDPTEVNFHFTEANSWQYSTYVPHDIYTLAGLMGGKNVLAVKLDSLFNSSSAMSGRTQSDITGMIGQYAHGNEPSHHAAYLYNYVEQPWKTQAITRKIMKELYTSKPDGLCGNEDCGQMSAWYVFSSMGFYPVTPGNNEYVIGSPLFDRVSVNLENGKVFTVVCQNQGADNMYIQSAKMNGRPYTKSYITYDDIKDGGTLEFVMGNKPNKEWGRGAENQPESKVENSLTMVPYFGTSRKSFQHDMQVSINLFQPKRKTDKSYRFPAQTDAIYYTVDGSDPDTNSLRYTKAFTIKQTTQVKAVAYNAQTGYSPVVEASYHRFLKDKKITIKSVYNPQYTAGGPDGLIDGVRGERNFRLGGWQGYQDQDFEAIVDLGKVQDIDQVSAGFLEEIRSWIWFPVSVTFEISSDNVNFELYGTVANPHPDNDYTEKTEDFTVKKKAKARYIRVKAKNYGNIPEWHLGAGGKAFIFIDEITIK